MKYTRKDIIVDPDDARLEIGAEYFTADSIRTVLEFANMGKYGFIVDLVGIVDEDSPFLITYSNGDSSYVDFLIRRKEPEKKYIPFDLSLEEDRAKLRGAWVRQKDVNEEILVIAIYPNMNKITLDDGFYTPESLLENYTFLDDTPCGRLIGDSDD